MSLSDTTDNAYNGARWSRSNDITDSQQRQVPTAVRATLINLLAALHQRERAKVLRFLAEKSLFTPPILDAPTLVTIAGHMVEIGKWRWL